MTNTTKTYFGRDNIGVWMLGSTTVSRIGRMMCLLATVSLFACAQAPTPPKIEQINAAIDKINQRQLRSDEHTPWTIVHAVIAFGQAATVFDVSTKKTVNAIDYLCNKATYNSIRLFRNKGGKPSLPTRNISYGLSESYKIQDHVDQYLMAFANAGVDLSQTLVTQDGSRFIIQDLLDAAKIDFVDTQELGWTLLAINHYLGPNGQWKIADGSTRSIGDLMALATQRDSMRETEGGHHHLFGIASVLNAHRVAQGTLEGRWLLAEEYLDRHITLAKRYQQDDGAFSMQVFQGSRAPNNARELVWSTGHMLEWLMLALPQEQLKAPWINHAVNRLVEEINAQNLSEFSDGGLYHAAHALRLYVSHVHLSTDNQTMKPD